MRFPQPFPIATQESIMPLLRAPFRRIVSATLLSTLGLYGSIAGSPLYAEDLTVRPAATIVELLQVESEEVVGERQSEQGSHIRAVKDYLKLATKKQKIR